MSYASYTTVEVAFTVNLAHDTRTAEEAHELAYKTLKALPDEKWYEFLHNAISREQDYTIRPIDWDAIEVEEV